MDHTILFNIQLCLEKLKELQEAVVNAGKIKGEQKRRILSALVLLTDRFQVLTADMKAKAEAIAKAEKGE